MTFTISATPAEGLTPLDVTIEIIEEPTIEAVTFAYDFGDGEVLTATTNEPQTHTFTEEGTFEISVTATDSEGETETATATITTEEPAAAVITITADKTQAYAPAEISFIMEITTDGTPADHVISWGFGDGTTETGTLTPRKLYTTAGSYTVEGTVTNYDGTLSTSTTVEITIEEPTYPAVSLTTSANGTAAVTITDTATHPDIQPDTAIWDFGDGKTTTATTPEGIRQQTHTYTIPGIYTVTLTRRYPTGQAMSGTASATTLTTLSTLKPVHNGVIVAAEYGGRGKL